MNSLRRCLLFVFLSVCISMQAKDVSKNQPQEYKANGFTFKIPTNWVSNDKIYGDINAQFDIKTTNGPVPVRFKIYPAGNADSTVSMLVETWKKFLENPNKVDWQTHSHTINDHEITYVEALGTLRYQSKALNKEILVHNFCFFGAVLDAPQGNVSLYMMGRTSVTDKLKGQFKHVIEDAVTNKEK